MSPPGALIKKKTSVYLKRPRGQAPRRLRQRRRKYNTNSKDIKVNFLSFLKEHRYERLKYKSVLTLQTNGTTEYTYATAYRMDSIFDPDWSNGGKNKSVEGYSLLATLYKEYKVLGFSAKVTFINMTSNSIVCYVGFADSNTFATDYATSKKPSDIYSRQGVKRVVLTGNTGSKGSATLTYKCHPGEPIGISKKSWLSDISTGATFGSNPNNTQAVQPFFLCGLGDSADGLTQAQARMVIEITYYTKLSNPIELIDQ